LEGFGVWDVREGERKLRVMAAAINERVKIESGRRGEKRDGGDWSN
jgi:hypothetical protein